MEFKGRIKSLRTGRGLTQTQLAYELGKGESAVRMREIGRSKPDADTLIKLAEYFGCTTDYLLGRRDSKNETEQKKEDVAMAELSDMIYGIEAPARGFLLSAFETVTQGYRQNNGDAFFQNNYISTIENISRSISFLAAINRVLKNNLPWPCDLQGRAMSEYDLYSSVNDCLTDITDESRKITDIVRQKYPDSVNKRIEDDKKQAYQNWLEYLSAHPEEDPLA